MSSLIEEEFSRAIDFYYDNSDQSDHDDSLEHVESFSGSKDVPFEPVKKLFIELKKKFKINTLADINKISKPEVVATYNKVNKGKKADIATIIKQVKQVSNVTSVVVMNNLETYQKMIGAVQKMQDQLSDLPKNKQISSTIDTFEQIKLYIQFFSDQSTKLVNLPPIQSDDDTDLTDTFRQLFFNLKEMLKYVNISDKKAAKLLNSKLKSVKNVDKVMNVILKSPLVIDSSKYTQSDIVKTLTDIYSYVLGNKNKKQLSELQNMMDKKLSGGKLPTFDTLGSELKKEQYLETLKIRTFRHQVIKYIIDIHKEMSKYQLKHTNIWSLTIAIEQLTFIQQQLVSDNYYKDLKTIYDNIKDQYSTQSIEIYTIFSRLEHMIKLLQELEDTQKIQSAIKELKQFFYKIANSGYQQTLEDIINDDFEINQDELIKIFYDTEKQLTLLKNKIIINQVKYNINRTHNELQTIDHESYEQQNAKYIESLFNSTDKYFEDIVKFYQDDQVKWDPQLSKFIYHVLLRFQTSSEIMPIENDESKSDIVYTVRFEQNQQYQTIDIDVTGYYYARQAKMLAYVQKKSQGLQQPSDGYFWEYNNTQAQLYQNYLNNGPDGIRIQDGKVPVEFDQGVNDMELCMDDNTLKDYLLPIIQIPFIQSFLHPNVMGRAIIKDSYEIEEGTNIRYESGYNIHALGISALPPIIQFNKNLQFGDKVFTKESLERLLDIYELYQSQIIPRNARNPPLIISNEVVLLEQLKKITDDNVEEKLEQIINNQVVFWNINAEDIGQIDPNVPQFNYQVRTALNDIYNYMLYANIIIQQCINNGCINIYDPVLRRILLSDIHKTMQYHNNLMENISNEVSKELYPRVCSKIYLKEEYDDTIEDRKVYNFKDFKKCLEESKLDHCIINNYLQVTEEDFEVLKVSMDKDDKDFKMRKYLSRCIYDQYRENARIIEKNETILKSSVEDDNSYDKSNFTQLLHKVIQLKKKGIFSLFSFMEKVEELLQQDLNKIHTQKIDLDQLYSLISQLMIKETEPIKDDTEYKYVINKHKSLVKQGKSMNFMSKLTGKGKRFTKDYKYSVIEYYKELEQYIKSTIIEVQESVEIENFIGIVTSIAVSSDKSQKTLIHNTLKSYLTDFLISNIIDVDTNILELPFEVVIHKQNETMKNALKQYVEEKNHDYIKENKILDHVTMQYSYKLGKDCSTKVIGTDSIFIPQLDDTYRYSNQSSLTAFGNKLYNQVLSALCNRVINTLGFFKVYKKEAMELEIKDISDFRVLTGAAKTRKTNKSHKEQKQKDEIRDVELYYRVFLLCKWYQSFFYRQQQESKEEAFLFIKPSSDDIRGEILQFVFKLDNDIVIEENDRYESYELSHVKKFIQNVNKLQDMTKSSNPQKVYDEIVKYVNTNYGIITKDEQKEIKQIKDKDLKTPKGDTQSMIKQILIDDLQYSFMPFSKPTKGITPDDVHDLIKSQLQTLNSIYNDDVQINMNITNLVKHIHYQVNNATSQDQKYQVIIDAFNKNQSINQHFDLALQLHENIFFSSYVLNIIDTILANANNSQTLEELMKYNDGFLVKIIKHTTDGYRLNTEQLQKHKTILKNYIDTHKKRIVSLHTQQNEQVYSSYRNIKEAVIQNLSEPEEQKEEFSNYLLGLAPNKFRIYAKKEESKEEQKQQQPPQQPIRQREMQQIDPVEYIKTWISNLQIANTNNKLGDQQISVSQQDLPAQTTLSQNLQQIPTDISIVPTIVTYNGQQYLQIFSKNFQPIDRQFQQYYNNVQIYQTKKQGNPESILIKINSANVLSNAVQYKDIEDSLDLKNSKSKQESKQEQQQNVDDAIGQLLQEEFKDRLLSNIESKRLEFDEIENDIESQQFQEKVKYMSMFNDIVEQLLDSTQTLMNSKQTLQYIFSGILQSPDLKLQYLVKKVSDIYKALTKEITAKNLDVYSDSLQAFNVQNDPLRQLQQLKNDNSQIQYLDKVKQFENYQQLIDQLLECNVLINTEFIDYGSNKIVKLILSQDMLNQIREHNTRLLNKNKLESLFSSSILLKMNQFINYRQQQENFGSKLEKNNEIFIVSQCVGAQFQLKQVHQMLKLKIQIMSEQLQEVDVNNELEFYDYLQQIMYSVLNGFNYFLKNKQESMTDFLHFSTLQQHKVQLSLFTSLISKSELTHKDNILYAKYLYNRVSGTKDISAQMGHLIDDRHHFQILEPLIFYIAQVNAKDYQSEEEQQNRQNQIQQEQNRYNLIIPESQLDVQRFKKLVQAKFIDNRQGDAQQYDSIQRSNLIDIGIFPININMLKKQIGLFNIFLNSEMFEQKLIKDQQIEDPYNLPYSYHRLDVKQFAVTETEKIKVDLQERIRLLLRFVDENVKEQRESKYHNIFKLLSS